MFRRLRQARVNVVVAAFYAVAMALLGFAHKPIYFPTPNGLDLAAYATPDGTLPTICGQTDRGAPAVHDHHCDACALTASPGLVPASQACLPAPASRRLVQRETRIAQFAPAPLHAPTSRGPPLA